MNHATTTTPRLSDATTATDPFITVLVADLHQFISRGSITSIGEQRQRTTIVAASPRASTREPEIDLQ